MIRKRIILYSIIFLCAVISLYRIIVVLPFRVCQNDFAHYYVSSRALIEHRNVYSFDFRDAFERYRFVYWDRVPRPANPPLLIWLFVPFAWMSPVYAFWGWVFIQGVSCFGIMWMMKRALAEYSSMLVWPFGCAIFLLSSGLYFNLIYSQVQLPLLALILGAYVLHKQRRPLIALTLIVIAGMTKLYPLVFIPWFIWRTTTIVRKRIMYALYVLFLSCGIVFATGSNLWIDFLNNGMPIISNTAINARGNYSLPSLVVNLGYSVYGFVPPLGVKKALMTTGGFVGIGIILATYASFFRTRKKHDVEFALLCIAAILGSITAWPHYLVFLLFPFSVTFCTVRLDAPWKRILMMIALVISATAGIELDLLQNQSFYTYELLLYYLPTFAMLILGGFLLFEIRKPSLPLNP